MKYDDVRVLKLKIQDELGIPQHAQRLTYQGLLLRDEMLLCGAGIRKESMIRLSARLRAGMESTLKVVRIHGGYPLVE